MLKYAEIYQWKESLKTIMDIENTLQYKSYHYEKSTFSFHFRDALNV